MSEVRLAVQRALDKLIGRFGTTGEVIGELRAALAALDKEEAKQGRPAAVETEAAIPAAVEVSPPAEPEAEPPPTKTPRKRSMGKGK